jgi:hypothetical protein
LPFITFGAVLKAFVPVADYLRFSASLLFLSVVVTGAGFVSATGFVSAAAVFFSSLGLVEMTVAFAGPGTAFFSMT